MNYEERFNAILHNLDTLGTKYQDDTAPHLVGRMAADVRVQVTELMKWANAEFYGEDVTQDTTC